MNFQTVGPLSEIPDGEGHLFRCGARQIALFRVGNDVRAIDNECPHAGASLYDGYTDGVSVVCPLHAWEFDVTTGECLTIPNMDVETFRVVVEEGIVKVELPE